MNWVDIAVVVIIVSNIWVAHKRGFVLTFFKFTSSILSLVLTYKLYPVVSSYLRQSTGLFPYLKAAVGGSMQLNEAANQVTLQAQTHFIHNLKMPDIFKTALIANNNPEAYNILGVGNLKEYVAGFIANICINIISMFLVLIIVTIGLRMIISAIDIVSKLPVLNSVNKLAGIAIGFVAGIIHIWILCILLTLFYTNSFFIPVSEAVDQSIIARYFYEYNLLLAMVSKIFF